VGGHLPGYPAVFLSGPLTPGGTEYIETADGRVPVVHVVPITEAERDRARELPLLDTATGLTAQADISPLAPPTSRGVSGSLVGAAMLPASGQAIGRRTMGGSADAQGGHGRRSW